MWVERQKVHGEKVRRTVLARCQELTVVAIPPNRAQFNHRVWVWAVESSPARYSQSDAPLKFVMSRTYTYVFRVTDITTADK